MKFSKSLAMLSALVAFAVVPSALQAQNLIKNGSFEMSKPAANPEKATVKGQYIGLRDGGTEINEWTVRILDQQGDSYFRSYMSNSFKDDKTMKSQEGMRFVVISVKGDQCIEQTVKVEANTNYEVIYYTRGPATSEGTLNCVLTFDAGEVSSPTTDAKIDPEKRKLTFAQSADGKMYKKAVFRFTPTAAANVKVRFQCVGGTYMLLDNVKLSKVVEAGAAAASQPATQHAAPPAAK